MRLALKLHPDSICEAVIGIEVGVERPHPGALVLHYLVTGTIGELRLPQPARALRRDELWKHTCFEAFVREPAGEAYYEFNFSPSTEWAAYRFDGYRGGMSLATAIDPPRIEGRPDSDFYELRASLDLPGSAPWRLGLSVVIEETNGSKSYWALAHPPGKADFHHPDSFILELPPSP